MSVLNFKSALRDREPRHREEKVKERVFLEHYSWLAVCALAITHGHRESAEDLLHDAFVQFTGKDTDLTSIGDLRSYLQGILRNLHLLQLRRATRHPVQQLSLMDHDSAPVSLRTWASTEQLQSADLLTLACAFACHRKEASLAASVLILRYFHGFYPGEICLLLSAKKKLIYRWIERGRAEAKAYMDAPYDLPETGSSSSAPKPGALPATPNALLARLRNQVFRSCTTDCSILAESPNELGVPEMAHLVSCRTCLEKRSQKMGLAHVAERMADDISDRDDGKPQGGSGGTGEGLTLTTRGKDSKRTILRRLYARKRQCYEHRPREISLAFDGLQRASVLVDAVSNTLHVSIDKKEIPDAIAVLSEQEFNFLLLDRNDLTVAERRVHRVILSDDRLLEVTVTPETLGPSIHVVYTDPLYAVVSDGAEEDLPKAIVAERPVLSFASRNTAFPMGGWRTTLLSKLRNMAPDMNPLLAGSIVLGIAALVCFVFWLRSNPPLTAGDLLDQAQKSERAATAANRPGVIYEKVGIRTPHRTLERSIYRDAQGTRRPRRQQLSPEDERLRNTLSSAGVSWDSPLSAIDYADWRYRAGSSRDEVARSGLHLLTLTTTPTAQGNVLRETLTVRDTDFHAVDRTIELRDSGTIEIAELNYDVLPWGAVNQDWFEPLAGGPGISGRVHPSLVPHLPYVPTSADLDEAELSARLVLNQLQADQGEQIELVRNGFGIVVRGLVDTEERKQAIDSQLIRVHFVTPLIFTFDEMARKQTSHEDETTSVKTESAVRQPSPLELYLVPHGKSQDEASQIARDLVDDAFSASRDGQEMTELLRQFSLASDLTPRAQDVLADLLENHERNMAAALDREEKILRDAGFVSPDTPDLARSGTPASQLSSGVSGNLDLCRELASTGGTEVRPAEAIAREILVEIAQLRNAARSISTVPDLTNATNGRPSNNKNQ
jgi:DNA-directed RNA polymerase specialized sigma24 family protein